MTSGLYTYTYVPSLHTYFHPLAYKDLHTKCLELHVALCYTQNQRQLLLLLQLVRMGRFLFVDLLECGHLEITRLTDSRDGEVSLPELMGHLNV